MARRRFSSKATATTTLRISIRCWPPSKWSPSRRSDKAIHSRKWARVEISRVGMFLARLFLRRFPMNIVEFVDGPQQAARDQFEVSWIRDGFVVVADRGGKHAGLAVVEIRPSYNA